MKVPSDFKCIECGKGIQEVNFCVSKQEKHSFLMKRCNKCIYKRKKINKMKNRVKLKLKRIESIRKRIEIYFRENYTKTY